MSKPRSPAPPDSVRGRRAEHRRHLAALYADIPPKRRAAFMRRAQEVLTRVLEDSEPEDTRYDEKGRIARMGTTKRDRAAIVRDALSSFKVLGEISRDATEQHIAVTRLMAGIFAAPPGGKPGSGSDASVPLESLSTLRETVEHNTAPCPTPSSQQLENGPPGTEQSSSAPVSPTSDDSQD